jgi:hypothetical protein
VTTVWNRIWESLLPFALWCNETWMGQTVRDSQWTFATVEVIHLWGLTILLGSVLVVYLRLAGLAMRGHSIPHLARQFAPWTGTGLGIMVVSGAMLFLSEAVKCVESEPFRIKMALFFPAVLFHFVLYRKMIRIPDGDSNPIFGKFAAVCAGSLWVGVGIAGRWIGFY